MHELGYEVKTTTILYNSSDKVTISLSCLFENHSNFTILGSIISIFYLFGFKHSVNCI